MPNETEVAALEDRLKAAMMGNDVDELDSLLAENLIFTDHQGRTVSKAEDLASHQSGLLKMQRLDFSDRRVGMFEHFAVVAVRTELAGEYDGMPFSGNYAYTRVWQPRLSGGFQVIAAHCSIIAC
jgi:hypothetical protein